jgi:hypothetical protein
VCVCVCVCVCVLAYSYTPGTVFIADRLLTQVDTLCVAQGA